ncbi:YbjQ family protein [Algoriphagus sp. NG3]|uniref:YbjQ family protein n=1 Tax=Algoriphagus sp. NG3 TaxID=3097546 RepID=UPI002A831CC6|nr:heavy metal-binding domain-containing protein [Algoriphagus sp. NG3]WPR73824.1 heavy metal-binding domain-containing protein [Algoriphagus sp. NG3]
MTLSILISSTESIEGMNIERYFDLISTNVVLGTNIFSDFGVSLSDIFGGSSDIYQNKLEKIYKIGIDKLKRKAQQVGANGIVGIRIDFDEVSGGGKSMFMLSVVGMAVKLKRDEANKNQIETSGDTVIQPEELAIQIQKNILIEKIRNEEPPSIPEWEFLMENPISEILDDLLKIYLFHFKDGINAIYDTQKNLRTYFPMFLSNQNDEIVAELLYSKISENPEVVSVLIKESRCFCPERTLGLIKAGDNNLAIHTLESDKRGYRNADLINMNEIVRELENLPDTGKIEMVKGLLGGSKEKFICERNHQNSVDVQFCTADGCGRNIKGIRESGLRKIEAFKLKSKALDCLLN